MSARLFCAIINDPEQGHLATGIDPTRVNLDSSLDHQLRRTIGCRACEDIVGVILPEHVWSAVEAHQDKLWRLPLAIIDTQSTFRAAMPK